MWDEIGLTDAVLIAWGSTLADGAEQLEKVAVYCNRLIPDHPIQTPAHPIQPILSQPTQFHLTRPNPIPSNPSYPSPAPPIQSHSSLSTPPHHTSHLISSHPIPSRLIPSNPTPSYPLPNPMPSHPSYPIPSHHASTHTASPHPTPPPHLHVHLYVHPTSTLPSPLPTTHHPANLNPALPINVRFLSAQRALGSDLGGDM